MPTDTSEKGLETRTINLLLESGWLPGENQDYNAASCVDLAHLAAFLQDTQPETAQALSLDSDNNTRRQLLNRLKREIANHGIIDVLRKGIEHEEMDDDALAEETGASKEEIRRILAQFTYTDDYEKWLAVTIRPSRPKEDELNKLLEEGTWRFENPPSPRKLILSDIPSTILRLGPEHPNWIYFQVPINETLLLIGHCGDARLESGLLPGSSQMSEEMIDLRNSTTLEDSEQFVYSSSGDEITRAIEQTRDRAQ